ncbi:MAG: tRNA pseudouridine(55) synthase TruB [Candidatus Omnitrophica bacterium]|nr:tRNA pseudouridine(55) synthase TruB [Candidatus Omnitrophota bacterium]
MDGILIVDKPQGMTSHDVVDFIRNKFKIKKVGHAGTLDPMATGVLVMLLGPATKSSGRFLSDDKEYEATLTLGGTSDTGDAWGMVTRHFGEPVVLGDNRIKAAFKKFMGVVEQTPPAYSAVKVKGRKLYEFARKGVTVKVEPRKVVIKELDITGVSIPEISFRVTCSKGTYVRQLCADIGKDLGCGAYLSCLKRTRSGPFTIAEAVTVADLQDLDPGELAKRLKSP